MKEGTVYHLSLYLHYFVQCLAHWKSSVSTEWTHSLLIYPLYNTRGTANDRCSQTTRHIYIHTHRVNFRDRRLPITEHIAICISLLPSGFIFFLQVHLSVAPSAGVYEWSPLSLSTVFVSLLLVNITLFGNRISGWWLVLPPALWRYYSITFSYKQNACQSRHQFPHVASVFFSSISPTVCLGMNLLLFILLGVLCASWT